MANKNGNGWLVVVSTSVCLILSVSMVWGQSDPHAGLTYADYPGNCLSCHTEQANEMMQTTHYQWLGDAPDMTNGAGKRQGKLTNAVNSYCINIEGDWPVCGTCHVGRGQRPDEAGNNPENVDCLMCHNDGYAAQRTRLPDGSMGVPQPDDGMVRNVHRPTRANCLACHAKAGGGDGVKRGDLSMATITNTDRSFDVHMNGNGSNLDCQACHVFDNHKVIGKGSDLRPTDDLARGAEVSCLTCHTDKNSPTGHDTAKINDHVGKVACQTCHIPLYAKVATETYRDWRTHHDGSTADASAVAGHPYTEKIANLTPVYKFWDRRSDNALLGDDASRTYNGDTDTWPTSTPLGSVTSGKLYPFKYKTAMQPKTQADHRLIALNTFEYLKGTGNADTAIQQGLSAMGYPTDEPYDWVLTDTYGLLNHGISPADNALQCADCHGSTDRMDLQGELGYQLKASQSSVCTQCHGSENNRGFTSVHDRHVRKENIDCGSCHNFSRTVGDCPGTVEIKHDGIDQDCNGYDLTIEVDSANYYSNGDRIEVYATSSLNDQAELEILGYGPMAWNAQKQQWEGIISNAGGDPGVVTVSGLEGSESTATCKDPCAADFNGDGMVGLADFSILSSAFGSIPGDQNWNPVADIDANGSVGLSDFSILSSEFGRSGCPNCY